MQVLMIALGLITVGVSLLIPYIVFKNQAYLAFSVLFISIGFTIFAMQKNGILNDFDKHNQRIETVALEENKEITEEEIKLLLNKERFKTIAEKEYPYWKNQIEMHKHMPRIQNRKRY